MRYKIINRAGSRDIFSGGVRYYLARFDKYIKKKELINRLSEVK
jgi:hypothetical protein